MEKYLIEHLNAPTSELRLKALRHLLHLHKSGVLEPPNTGNNVNNHIHTTFSFSPYSPTKALYLAWLSGLATAGIMDHDSVGGAMEFIEAGRDVGFPITVGFECRVSIADTPFAGMRLNNPDQKSVAYVAMHAIPHQMLDMAELFLAPYREKRNNRNNKMTQRLNEKIKPFNLELSFDEDVLPLSQALYRGSVTERHILYALASKLTEPEFSKQFLLGQFKSQLIESIYIDAHEELPHISDFVGLAKKLGAIPAYAYLGDVGDSVTGDKKAQSFEDSFLDELLVYLKDIGFKAITYMPARNTSEQLARIKSLCQANNLFQISGEDINSPLQSFICDKINTPEFCHLIDSAWALIGHERASAYDISKGMFSAETEAAMPDLNARIKHFAKLGKI